MATTSIKYNNISEELQEQIRRDRQDHWVNPYACQDDDIIRRNPDKDKASLWRPAFVRDCEKIIHLPYYNRYTDKTQVFSSLQNDDISRRALHVQLVSRIARNIGRMLGLNCDLIEAIALGHDLGHTPFGHAGEKCLSDILQAETGMYFNHNIQSGRVLDTLFTRNVSLQALDGIICHNGEFELKEYCPQAGKTFDDYDESVRECFEGGSKAIKKLVPMTLEGCVVRISDMIAYLGKDRQDACKSGIITQDIEFTNSTIGSENAAIINNIVVDIIENSYGKDCILLSDPVFHDLEIAKKENYQFIYLSDSVGENYAIIGEMFEMLYDRLLGDLKAGNRESTVFAHHVDMINEARQHYITESTVPYEDEKPELIVADYLASMTDTYFTCLFEKLFPDSPLKLRYISYFNDCNF